MSEFEFTVKFTTESTSPESIKSLMEELTGRTEFILGEEYGDPEVPVGPYGDNVGCTNWGADVETYGYDRATITGIKVEIPPMENGD